MAAVWRSICSVITAGDGGRGTRWARRWTARGVRVARAVEGEVGSLVLRGVSDSDIVAWALARSATLRAMRRDGKPTASPAPP